MKKIISISLLLFWIISPEAAFSDCASCNKQKQSFPVYLQTQGVSVSSFDTTPDWAPIPKAEAAIDGSLLTRWSSGYEDNQWISFDFGQLKTVNKIIVFWEAAYAVDYDILTSLDNESWQLLLSLEKQDGQIDQLEFAPVQARFIKLLAKKRVNPQWGISIWEFLCLGPQSKNPADKPLSLIYPPLANKLEGKPEIAATLQIEEPQPSPGGLSLDELQKGVVYTSWGKAELGTDASDRTLEHLYKIGIRHLGIMIVWYQDSIEENTIFPDAKDTPEDQALAHAINQAHRLGMKVMLKPHVDIRTDEWRGDIIPSQEWFTSYKTYVIYYARLAARYNVELFSIGTELGNTTLPKWQHCWEGLIAELRQIYPGYLTYSANWDEYNTVGFWNKLDFVGIDAYFPLTNANDPTKEELIAAWDKHMAKIDSWLKETKLNKPVVFNEIGYCSADGTNTQPWAVLSNLSQAFIDQEEQAHCLEAMLRASSAYSWFKGFYWWNYFPQERWSPLGYTIRGKEAEETLTKWLESLGRHKIRPKG